MSLPLLTYPREVGFSDGLELGFSDGLELGFSDGLELGFPDGFELGFPDGFELGFPDGLKLMLGLELGEEPLSTQSPSAFHASDQIQALCTIPGA